MSTRWTRAVAVLCLAGCAATETGNPITEQHLALTARSSVGEVALGPSVPDGVAVQAAWVVLGDIRFVQSTRCDSGGGEEADIPGPTVVELVADPLTIELELQSASYCRVRVPLDRAEQLPAGAPAELGDHAIVLLGTRTDGTAFVLRSRQTREADIRSQSEPFSVQSADAGLILAVDVGRWLAGVDLDALTPDAQGVIRIDEDNAGAQLDRFEENVELAMELFRDLDDDGSLDDGETSELLASGQLP